MYLIQLTLDPRRTQARRDLSDPYEMHRTLARAFVSDKKEKPERFLWRLEAGVNPWASPKVLIQAKNGGDWAWLIRSNGYLLKGPNNEGVQQKEVQLEHLVRPQCRYRFRLHGNPTVTRNGKRLGLVGEGAQLEWLQRQGKRWGFDVVSAMVTGADVVETRRKEHGPITIHRVCYEGVLEVVRAPDVQSALVAGIGPAKAFGCGMLNIAKLKPS